MIRLTYFPGNKLEEEGKSMYASISTRELDEKRKSYDIIDVRDREAFLERHIDGAENIPIEELEEHLDHLSKEKNYAVICYSGKRSMSASEFLDGQGFQVTNVRGGMNEW